MSARWVLIMLKERRTYAGASVYTKVGSAHLRTERILGPGMHELKVRSREVPRGFYVLHFAVNGAVKTMRIQVGF